MNCRYWFLLIIVSNPVANMLCFSCSHCNTNLTMTNLWSNGPMTCSSPRRPLYSHSLVCSEDYLFIVGIGPIRDKNLTCIFFDKFLLFGSSIEDRYIYYKINVIYTSVSNFCYNVIYLQYFLCFGLYTLIFSVLLL